MNENREGIIAIETPKGRFILLDIKGAMVAQFELNNILLHNNKITSRKKITRLL